jgi:tetratricopeptide (TPR) repeat protein
VFNWNHIQLAAADIPLPAETDITPADLTIYKQTLDRANMFRGRPAILVEALQILKECNSLPLAYAGRAYLLFVAAGVREYVYDQEGLTEAQRWLAKAQAIAPDIPEINFIGVFLALFTHRDETAKLLLKPLIMADNYGYYVRTALMCYFFLKRSEVKLFDAYRAALPFAKTIERRAYLHFHMAGYFLQLGLLNRSLSLYQELLRLTPYDPWMWHDLSIIHMKKGNLFMALRCNKNSLALMEFDGAYQMKDQIMGRIGKLALFLAFLAFVALVVALQTASG